MHSLPYLHQLLSSGGALSTSFGLDYGFKDSCLTLILACIVYWQVKEINRVVLECDPEGNGIDLRLIEHISPITWDNIILYGEYVLDEKKVRL